MSRSLVALDSVGHTDREVDILDHIHLVAPPLLGKFVDSGDLQVLDLQDAHKATLWSFGAASL